MAQLSSIVELELLPEVTSEEFERYIAEALAVMQTVPGVRARWLRSDRGERDGKYLLLMEIDSVERRNQLYPKPGEPSAEQLRWLEEHGQAWKKYFSLGTVASFSDYVELGVSLPLLIA
jgi:hypothetical protein